MNLRSLISLAVAAAFAAPVAAQTPRTSPGPDTMTPKSETAMTAQGEFAALDKNNDGYLSRDEAQAASWTSRFIELDKDNDGRISRGEYEAMQGAARGATGKKPQR